MAFPVEPCMDRVFIKKDDMSVDSESGLFLPAGVKDRAQTGTVVAAGPGYYDTKTGKFLPLSLKEGDRVFAKEYDGAKTTYNNQDFFIFSEKEIVGKLTMDNFPIQPLGDRVFVEKDDASIDKETGFFMPETVKGRAKTGTVVAAGPGYLDLETGVFAPMNLKVGDRVFIKAFDGYIISYEGREFFIFTEKEILGKVKESV